MKHVFSSKCAKLTVLLLALLLVLGLTGCSRNEEPVPENPICTVTADLLNVRKDHDPDSKIVGQLPLNTEIEIQEQMVDGDILWGRIDKMELSDGTKIKGGWINLQYVQFPDKVEDETEPTDPPTDPPMEPAPELPTIPATMGTVTTGKLNIRKGAGSKYGTNGTYAEGDRIEIEETTTVDETVWGKTGRGWVSMAFVRMDGTAESSNTNIASSDGKTGVLGYGVVDLGSLNVRQGPGTEYDKTRSVPEGARYAYYQIQGDWVRIEDGWVSTEYFYIEGSKAADAISGIVDTEELKIRTGPATAFKSNGSYKQGNKVEILGQVDGWGYTSKGWISMRYVKSVAPTYTTGVATITSGLNIRKEANADSEAVGTYQEGDVITILEVKNGWGKTDKGWINLKYVNYG